MCPLFELGRVPQRDEGALDFRLNSKSNQLSTLLCRIYLYFVPCLVPTHGNPAGLIRVRTCLNLENGT